MLIDSHAHIDDADFDRDRDDIFRRAAEAGVGWIVLVGMLTRTVDKLLGIAERRPDCTIATVGLHPHDAKHFSGERMTELRDRLGGDRVRGLGEIGLDYFRDNSPEPMQKQAFRAQLEIAAELRLPFVLHCRDAGDGRRDAYADSVTMIREVYGSQAAPVERLARPIGVAHCFSGNAEQARAFLDCGLVLSWAGHVTFKKSEGLRDAARATDPAVWLVETDAPYLAPVPKRGKRNEPAFVRHTAEFLAGLKGMPPAELAAVTTANTRRLFRF
jgi:TatD DNase family protein